MGSFQLPSLCSQQVRTCSWKHRSAMNSAHRLSHNHGQADSRLYWDRIDALLLILRYPLAKIKIPELGNASLLGTLLIHQQVGEGSLSGLSELYELDGL